MQENLIKLHSIILDGDLTEAAKLCDELIAEHQNSTEMRAMTHTSTELPELLPEPSAVVVAIDRKVFADGVLRVSSASISFCDLEKVDLGSSLYTEHQVRQLLATRVNSAT